MAMITLDLDAALTNTSTQRAINSLSVAVAKSKKVVVVSGAGISCSSGIPDFRSSDGLYALVEAKYPKATLKGSDLFDAGLFANETSTKLFYTFMSELKMRIDEAKPSPAHHFIKTLDTKGKLLRSYTQNIDGFEEKVGLQGRNYDEQVSEETDKKEKKKFKIEDMRNVLLHGDIHRVRCPVCSASFPCSAGHITAFQEAMPPECPECLQRSNARLARNARGLKVGRLRPAIVLYNENHPYGEDIGYLQTVDMNKKPDLLIIMGTSLKVHGIKSLVKNFSKAVHGREGKVIYVNKTEPAGEWNQVIDYWVTGETDAWVAHVLAEWKKSRPQDWEVQTTLLQSKLDDTHFKVVKGIKAKGKSKKGGKENIPPAAVRSCGTDAAKQPYPTPPLSPSKRKSQSEDIEGSPTKRRGRALLPAASSKRCNEASSDVDVFLDAPTKTKGKASLKKVKEKVPVT